MYSVGDILKIVVAVAGISTLLFAETLVSAFSEPDPCAASVPASHTVVVVDRTDAVPQRVGEWFQGVVEPVSDELPVGAHLSLYTIDGRPPAEPVQTVCRPKNGDDANWLTEGSRWLDKVYRAEYAHPVRDMVATLAEPAEAPTSPIFETIAAIAARPEFSSDVQDRSLIIFSDLLANVPAFSQYHTHVTYDSFRRTAYARRVVVPLDGVTVRILYVANARAAAHQGAAHIQFWTDWFEDMGARVAVEVVS